MNNPTLNINKLQNEKKNDFTEEEYEEINKDISKALINMKIGNKEEEKDNESDEEEVEDSNVDYFSKDFFTDSSNSISYDNLSELSERSFKSTNPETKNNSIKNNIINNNINNNFLINKDISEPKNLKEKKQNENINIDGNKNMMVPNNNNGNIVINNGYQNNINNNIFMQNINNTNNIITDKQFNDRNFQKNLMKEQFLIDNNFNNINTNNHNNNNIIQINYNQPFYNYSMNNINNYFNNNRNYQPIIQINNSQMNNNPNIDISMFNNNMNNNLNLMNTNPNNYMNNSTLFNNNTINHNNNLNYNQILMGKNKKNNSFFSFPVISERGVPGLYNMDSPKNIINLENILRNRDKRTTLIIRNIPNKYTISLLLKELDHNYENKYDIVYLPQDYINNSNLGFGFINFVNPMHLILFYEEFVNKKWNFFNSKKRCNLAYSKYQGKNELIKYILTKLGISSLDNNSENIKKSFFINNNKNFRAPIEVPIKYYTYFVSYHPFSLCHYKDDKVFIIDKYYNI